MARYYIYNSNQEVEGPFEPEELKRNIQLGIYNANIQVCLEGTEQWQVASSISELSTAPSPTGNKPAPYTSTHTQSGTTNLEPVGYVGPILLTLCLCMIGGILAIIYTSLANEALARRDEAAYLRHRTTRRRWIIWSIIIGVIANAIALVVQIAALAGTSGVNL